MCQSKDHSVRGCVKVRYTGGNCCYKCGLQKFAKVHIHGEIGVDACIRTRCCRYAAICGGR